jgi:hypothetical protein
MNCEFCNQTFKTKGILKNHQQTAKYCLDIQNKTNDKWKCNFCNKVLTSKQTLEKHNENCVNKNIFFEKDNEIKNLKNEIILIKEYHKNEVLLKETFIKILEEDKNKILKEKDELISKLQNQIIELAERAIDKPTYGEYTENTTNSNNKMIDNRVLNMIPLNLTQNQIEETVENKYTESHFMKGQKGVAEFCIKNIIVTPDKKLMLKCTDPSRKVFIYLDGEGKVIKDINAEQFIGMIEEPVKKASKRIFSNIQDRYENPEEEEEGYEVDEGRFNHALQKMVEISNLKTENGEFIRRIIPSIS